MTLATNLTDKLSNTGIKVSEDLDFAEDLGGGEAASLCLGSQTVMVSFDYEACVSREVWTIHGKKTDAYYYYQERTFLNAIRKLFNLPRAVAS